MRLQIAVFFGGRSVEHDISIITGQQFMDHMDAEQYEIVPVYITREGGWYTGGPLRDVGFFKRFDAGHKELKRVWLSPVPGEGLIVEGKKGLFSKGEAMVKPAAAVLAMHGMNGEDGTLQGLLELANIPYTSPGLTGSAVGMDKVVMKDVFRGMGLPVLDAVHFNRGAVFEQVRAVVEEKLGYPVIVKPVNLGSSIGINKAKDAAELEQAVTAAAGYDRRVIVEKAVENLMEINCSGLGWGEHVQASACEQPLAWEQFLSFEDKYLRGGKNAGGGMKTMGRVLPAQISAEMTAHIQEMTVRIFKELECKGVVRIDYIVDLDDETVYVNEINTIPGSFAFYLWEAVGLPFKQLADKLIADAISANAERNKSVFAYDSNVLSKVSAGAKGGKAGK